MRLAPLWSAWRTRSKRHHSSNGDPVQARPLGIHLEGPFLSHKRRGVHPPEYLVEPTVAIFDRLWQAARGHVRMMTIAPEIPGAMEVIAEAARRNVCVSIGHSDAEIARRARRGEGRRPPRDAHFQRHASAGSSRSRDHRRSAHRRPHDRRHDRRRNSRFPAGRENFPASQRAASARC